MTARSLQKELDYKEWRNFEGVIKRALNFINNGFNSGRIIKTLKTVKIGSKSERKIIDYYLDSESEILIRELCSNFKINKSFHIRNEITTLSLIKKYYDNKGVDFVFQKRFSDFVYDAFIGEKILFEYNEPHHSISSKQIKIDKNKKELAVKLGYNLITVTLEMDIIDCLILINKEL